MDQLIINHQKKTERKKKRFKYYRGMIRLEQKRVFSMQSILITVLLFAVVLGLDILSEIADLKIRTLESLGLNFYQLFTEMIYKGGFYILLFIPVSLFIVLNLYQDIQEKMFFYFACRSNIRAYIIIKIIFGILFTFLITFFLFSLYVAIGVGIMPVLPELPYDSDPYWDLFSKSPLLYFILRNFYISLVMALFSGVGMIVTVFIPNMYMAILSPLLSYLIVDKLIVISDNFLSPFSDIMAGLERNSDILWTAIMSEFLFFIFCYCIVGVIFYKGMKWRCYGEWT